MSTLVTASAVSRPARPAGGQIPFARLLRVEWFKAVDTRASRWLLSLAALATVAVMAAPVLATSSFDQRLADYLTFAAFAVSVLLPVIAALVLTSEWSQRTVLTTFTQEPRRHRVMLAKAGAVAALTAIACGFAALVSVLALAVSAGLGRDVSWHLGTSVGVGFVVGVVLNVAVGVGFAAVLQNSAGAIVAIFALPAAVSLLTVPLHALGQWVDLNVMLGWVSDGEWAGHVAKIVVSTLVWIVLPLAAGVLRTVRREIS